MLIFLDRVDEGFRTREAVKAFLDTFISVRRGFFVFLEATRFVD